MSNLEQTAARIYEWLCIHHSDFDNMPRDAKMLSVHTGFSEVEIIESSIWLCSHGFARMRGVHLEPTEEGNLWIVGLSINPFLQISILSWKNEVLTGMTSGGNETQIRDAVLPMGSYVSPIRDPESRMMRLISMVERALRAGIAPEEIKDVSSSKKTKICKVCNRVLKIEQFYTNKTSTCKQCQSKKRKSI